MKTNIAAKLPATSSYGHIPGLDGLRALVRTDCYCRPYGI